MFALSITMRRSSVAPVRYLHQCHSRPVRRLPDHQHVYRGTATAITIPSPQIHVLGLGSIGTFAAHTLAEIPARPPVTLLLHRQSLMDDYIRIGKRIILETHEGELVKHGEYGFEVLHGFNWHKAVPDFHSSKSIAEAMHSPLKNTIYHLIVSVKSTQTVAALRPLVPRLTRESSIVFLQNGAGMIEDVNEALWPNPNTRPSYITGVISHGVTLKGPFDIKHTGPAATSLGPVPRGDELNSPTSASTACLLDALPRAPRLNCRSYEWPDILQKAARKACSECVQQPSDCFGRFHCRISLHHT